MNILVFHTAANDPSILRKLGILETQTHIDEMTVCENLTTLRSRLRKLGQRPDVAVLFASNSEELKQLVNMKEQFSNVSVIAVIPDENKENVSLGYKLYPRFLTSIHGDLSIISAILNKWNKWKGRNSFTKTRGSLSSR